MSDVSVDPRVAAAYAALSPAQRAQLSVALARRAAVTGIHRVDRTGDPLPASYGQERLWFLDQLRPGSVAYVMPVALRLTGPLDVVALGRALRAVVARHEALRTTFPVRGGQPVQRVAADVDVPLVFRDLCDRPPTARAAAVRAAQRDEAGVPFDLAAGPLVRAGLLRTGATEHVLLLSVHHIVADGWSLAVLVNDLAEAYRTGAAPAPPDIQYADFVAWQRERLGGGRLEEQVAYWRGVLRGAPALNVPTDRPRDGAPRGGGSIAVHWPPDLVAGLRGLAAGTQATLFMALFAGVAATLGRRGRQRDVVVGTPVAGRGVAELEPVVGFFVNTLPLRLAWPGDPTFADLLSRARDATLAGLAHQDVPYERVADAVRPDRGGTPLVQVLLALGPATTPPPMAGVTIDVLPAPVIEAKVDLTWELNPTADGGLAGRLEYDAELFDETTVVDLHDSLTALLRHACDEPDAPLSRLAGGVDGMEMPPDASIDGRVEEPPAPASIPPADSVPPRDALERLLLDVWTEVLGVHDIGVLDDFFELGGHSLLVTRALARVQDTLGVVVPLDGAMTATTIRDFAGYLREVGASAGRDVDAAAESGAAPAETPEWRPITRIERVTSER